MPHRIHYIIPHTANIPRYSRDITLQIVHMHRKKIMIIYYCFVQKLYYTQKRHEHQNILENFYYIK
jgi:hypothetical protein